MKFRLRGSGEVYRSENEARGRDHRFSPLVRGAKEKRELADMKNEVERIPVDADDWRFASRLALRCRERGLAAPNTDIADSIATHWLELEHCDRHFDDLLVLAKGQ